MQNSALNGNLSRQGTAKENDLPADLRELAGLWPRLSAAVRAGLLGTARAVAGVEPEDRADA